MFPRCDIWINKAPAAPGVAGTSRTQMTLIQSTQLGVLGVGGGGENRLWVCPRQERGVGIRGREEEWLFMNMGHIALSLGPEYWSLRNPLLSKSCSFIPRRSLSFPAANVDTF